MCAVKGREAAAAVSTMYPFTVSLPRSASWRCSVRMLLQQLRACDTCRAAADAVPIATLPRVHTLASGKVLLFKGLATAAAEGERNRRDLPEEEDDGSAEEEQADRSIMDFCNEPTVHHQYHSTSTFLKYGIEEYDMVSIDSNCPKHRKYSLTTWLHKERTKVVSVKGRKRRQIYPKAMGSHNHHIKRIKQVPTIDGIGKSKSSSFWKPLDKIYEHLLDNNVGGKPSRVEVPFGFKKSKNENSKQIVLKQIEANTTFEQTNITSTYDYQKDPISQIKQRDISKIQMKHLSRKIQFISDKALSKSDDNKRMSVKSTRMERAKYETPCAKDGIPISNKGLRKNMINCLETYTAHYRKMYCLKEQKYKKCSHSSNESVEGNSEKTQHEAVSASTIESKLPFVPHEHAHEENDKFINDMAMELLGEEEKNDPTRFTRKEQLMANDEFDVKELEHTKQQLEWVEHENDKLANETQINLVENEPSTCTSNRFVVDKRGKASGICDILEDEQAMKELKCVQNKNANTCTPTRFTVEEHQSRKLLEYIPHENENLADETNTCPLTRFTIEEQQMGSSIFDMKELEKTQQKLERIVGTTKSLQKGLNHHHQYNNIPIVKVHFSRAQFHKRNEVQKWLSNMAIEGDRNKISKTCNGGIVHQLVQAFESIK